MEKFKLYTSFKVKDFSDAEPTNSTERNSTTYNTFGSSRIGFLQNNIYNYEIKDHRGTVRTVLINANLQSSLVQYADYLPLGGKMNGRQFTNTGAQLSLGYQGEWTTDETAKIGLIDFDFRQYDPTIGRWNSIDQHRQFYSGYVGMGNNWPTSIDPDGRDVILLNYKNGADRLGFPLGHTAMLVGSESKGWTYIPKEGTHLPTGVFGPPNKASLKVIKYFDDGGRFNSLDEFLSSKFNKTEDGENHYDRGLYFETSEIQDEYIIGKGS